MIRDLELKPGFFFLELAQKKGKAKKEKKKKKKQKEGQKNNIRINKQTNLTIGRKWHT